MVLGDSILTEKQLIRKKLQRARRLYQTSLHESQLHQAQLSIYASIEMFIEKNLVLHRHIDKSQIIIGSYQPLLSEFPMGAINSWLSSCGYTLSYPVTKGDQMHYMVDQDLCVEPNLLLVPLVAIDLKGYRLGMGKGYFDRYLSTRQVEVLDKRYQCYSCGIGFAMQQVESLPRDDWDKALDSFISPSGQIFFKIEEKL